MAGMDPRMKQGSAVRHQALRLAGGSVVHMRDLRRTRRSPVLGYDTRMSNGGQGKPLSTVFFYSFTVLYTE